LLEEPDLQDEKIISCLQDVYGLPVVRIAFLPLGADRNTAVYRIVAEDETAYFLKLRGVAYYRYERIIQDIAVFCEQIFSTQGIRADRGEPLQYLTSNFLPNGTIEIAYKSDKALIER